MTDFVLVHGAWHGGWCWRYVADRLRLAGIGCHADAHGLASVAPAHADVGLDTHITTSSLIHWEELSDAVLVGHSYAGYVVSGAAEQIAAR